MASNGMYIADSIDYIIRLLSSPSIIIIGASLSEPHTSESVRNFYVCFNILVCPRPYQGECLLALIEALISSLAFDFTRPYRS